jgi:hypothetical protein
MIDSGGEVAVVTLPRHGSAGHQPHVYDLSVLYTFSARPRFRACSTDPTASVVTRFGKSGVGQVSTSGTNHGYLLASVLCQVARQGHVRLGHGSGKFNGAAIKTWEDKLTQFRMTCDLNLSTEESILDSICSKKIKTAVPTKEPAGFKDDDSRSAVFTSSEAKSP